MNKAKYLLLFISFVGCLGVILSFEIKTAHTFYTLNAAGTGCNVVSTTIMYTTTIVVTELDIHATPTSRNITSGVPSSPCWRHFLTPSI